MTLLALPRGTGSFFTECEHPRSRWSKCPHLYEIRFRGGRGQAKAQRVAKYGAMRFGEYAAEWKAGLSSTQNYYRVSQDRRRDAVDRVVALQFDRNGTRV